MTATSTRLMKRSLASTSMVACLLVAGICLAAPAAMAVTPTSPDSSAYVPNGEVSAIAHAPDGTTYIGGSFSRIGPRTGTGAAISASTGSLISGFPEVAGPIYTAVSDGAGGYYIGGRFHSIAGQPRRALAHILPDKTVDPTFNPAVSNSQCDSCYYVAQIVVIGQTLYVSGWFSAIDGQNRANVAAVNATTGDPTAWNPNPNGFVSALATNGSHVYAGGNFTSIGGQPRAGLAELDLTTGAATAWNADLKMQYTDPIQVTALATSSAAVYATGNFNRAGDKYRSGAAAISTRPGSQFGKATAWDPRPNGYVTSMQILGSKVYMAGNFNYLGHKSKPRNNVGAVSTGSGGAAAWNPNVGGGSVNSINLAGSTIYISGYFNSVGGQQRNNLAAVSRTSGKPTSWDPEPNGEVWGTAISGSTLYAGGDFSSVGGVARQGIAALDASGQPTSWNPGMNGGVQAMVLSGSTLYVGGYFSSIGGQPRASLAALNIATGAPTSWNAGALDGGGVLALALSGSTLYVAGSFTSIGGQSRKGVAALNTTSGAVGGWNPNPASNGSVTQTYALATNGSTVYIAGYFDKVGGQPHFQYAAVDATTGVPTAWNPNPHYPAGWGTSTRASLAVSGSTVYTAGTFNTIGGQLRPGLAALDATTGAATGWTPAVHPSVGRALTLSGTQVYSGGYGFYGSIDSTTGAEGWHPDPITSLSGGEVVAIAVSGSNVYVGGNFTSLGSAATANYAQFTQ